MLVISYATPGEPVDSHEQCQPKSPRLHFYPPHETRKRMPSAHILGEQVETLKAK